MWFNWPGICAKYNLDASKICGPTAVGRAHNGEGNCCYAHAAGCDLHKCLINGQRFDFDKAKNALMKANLIQTRPELKEERDQNKNPPGTPQKQGQVLIYPARHFA